MPIIIPETFQKRMITIYGDAGKVWLAQLPQEIQKYAQLWGFQFEAPVANLSYNYVAKVTLADNSPAIFKIGFPNKEIFTEIDTLTLYEGEGMVRLLRADRPRAAFLLEHIIPGTELAELADDEQATRVIAHIIHGLHRPPPQKHQFPHLLDWLKAFDRYLADDSALIPAHFIKKGMALIKDIRPQTSDVLLHGDLHHYNILQMSQEQWVVIDPKGVVGPLAYDVGRFLHNPFPKVIVVPDPKPLLNQRIKLTCDILHLSPQEVLRWGYIDMLLSVIWSVQDNDFTFLAESLNFAQAFLDLGLE